MRLRRRDQNHNEGRIIDDMIKFNRIDELEKELEKESVQNSINKLVDGFSPLHIAAQVGNNKAIELILMHGGNINCKSSNNQTPLDISYQTNQQKTSVFLLEHNAKFTSSTSSVDRYYNGDIYTATKDTGRTLLHWSAKLGSIEAITNVLSQHVDINCVNDNGSTALHQACSFGHEHVISYLLEHGASIMLTDNKGNTPLSKCKGGADGELLHKIRSLHFPLHEVVLTSNTHHLQELLNDSTINKHIYNEDGYTAFQLALLSSQFHLCNLFLFQTTANISISTLNTQQIQTIIQYLTIQSYQINTYQKGNNAFELCCKSDNIISVEYIITLLSQLPEQYYNLLLSESQLNNALFLCGLHSALNCIKLLAKYGANIYYKPHAFISDPPESLNHLERLVRFSEDYKQELKQLYEHSKYYKNWRRRKNYLIFLIGCNLYHHTSALIPFTSSLSSTTSTTTTTTNKQMKLSSCEFVFGIDLCVVKIASYI